MLLLVDSVLRSLSPSLRREVMRVLRPYKKWRTPALLSAAFFLMSSLLLWGKGDSLARLGVPPDRIPTGPLDVEGHTRYPTSYLSS